MSSRMMRRLLQEQQGAAAAAKLQSQTAQGRDGEEGGEEEDESDAGEAGPEQAVRNSFGLLWADMVNAAGDEEEDEEADDDEGGGEDAVEGKEDSGTALSALSSSKKSKKKKKKKKGGKAEGKSQGNSVAGPATLNGNHTASAKVCDDIIAIDSERGKKGGRRDADGSAGKKGGWEAAGGSSEARGAATATPAGGLGGAVRRQRRELLQVDAGFLKAEDELKRIFGAKVMRAVDRQEAAKAGGSGGAAAAAGLAGAGPGGGRRGGAGGRRSTLRASGGASGSTRKFVLVQPLDEWPPVEKGDLTMEFVGRSGKGSGRGGSSSSSSSSGGGDGSSKGGVRNPGPGSALAGSSGGSGGGAGGREALKGSATAVVEEEDDGDGEEVLWFRYQHSASYGGVQRAFEQCVESHDPEALANLVAHHPYHAEGLVALSDVYRHMGEVQAASELLDRALFVLESVWHPWFNPLQANCRLNYAWEPNQALFHALFRNVQQLSRRGCHRAAFESAKLLYALNPAEDPHGVVLAIDYFALRAQQQRWVADFVNAAAAVAAAAAVRRVAGKNSTGSSSSSRSLALLPNYAFSLALAEFMTAEEAEEGSADDGAVAANSRRRGSSSTTRSATNSQVSPADARAAADDLLKDALLLHPYALRPLLEKAAVHKDAEWNAILRSPPFSSPPAPPSPSLEHLVRLWVERGSLLWRPMPVQRWLKRVAAGLVAGMKEGTEVKDEAANWMCVRDTAFASRSNDYRHLLVSDFSDTVSTLPPEVLMQDDAQAHMRQEVLDGVGGAQPPDVDALGMEGRNVLLAFIESLMPWNNMGVDLRGQDVGGAGGPPGGAQGGEHRDA